MSDAFQQPDYLNYQTLYNKAGPAIVANIAFLANATPTNADIVAQVRALTRQHNAIIRMLVGMLNDTAGT